MSFEVSSTGNCQGCLSMYYLLSLISEVIHHSDSEDTTKRLLVLNLYPRPNCFLIKALLPKIVVVSPSRFHHHQLHFMSLPVQIHSLFLLGNNLLSTSSSTILPLCRSLNRLCCFLHVCVYHIEFSIALISCPDWLLLSLILAPGTTTFHSNRIQLFLIPIQRLFGSSLAFVQA